MSNSFFDATFLQSSRRLDDPFDGYFRNGTKRTPPARGLLDISQARRWFEVVGWGSPKDLYTNQQALESKSGPRVQVGGQQYLMISSYDYLGFIGHPAIEAAAIEAIREYGTGTGGVRLLVGTTTLHRQFEKELAAFKGVEAAMTFGSGYMANLGIIYLQHGAAPFMFSAALCPAAIAAAREAIHVLQREPERLVRLRRNTDLLRHHLAALGYGIGASNSPIVPIIVGADEAAYRLARDLFGLGIIASAIVKPAVPPGGAWLRLCATAAQDEAFLQEVVEGFRKTRTSTSQQKENLRSLTATGKSFREVIQMPPLAW